MSPDETRRPRAALAALWGVARRVELAPADAVARSSFSEEAVLLPRTADERLTLARIAHVGAHLALGSGRFATGTLKPSQVTLVSLIEDARVERLALRDRPGLLRLWLPFHNMKADSARTAPDLMARLARALLDPGYDDPDPWVTKGRRLFFADPAAWADPAISRAIGGLLGNDLGQMRVPFSARSYMVEPVYRDDNLGLWEQAEDKVAPAEQPQAGADDAGDPRARPDGTGDAAVERESPGGGRLFHHPEWDRRIRAHRPDWVTLREDQAPALGPSSRPGCHRPPAFAEALAALQPRRPAWAKRQLDGEEIDLAAAIDAVASVRAGRSPDIRIHLRRVGKTDPVPVLVLLDISASTADRLPEGGTVLSLQTRAASAVTAALAAGRLPHAIWAFHSSTRHDARILRVKDWTSSPADTPAKLASLCPSLSTRMGAALRHAARGFDEIGESRGILLAITDGEPADIDVFELGYLVEDAREACLALRRRGIVPFGIGIGAGDNARSLSRIFGPGRAFQVRSARDLARRLTALATTPS